MIYFIARYLNLYFSGHGILHIHVCFTLHYNKKNHAIGAKRLELLCSVGVLCSSVFRNTVCIDCVTFFIQLYSFIKFHKHWSICISPYLPSELHCAYHCYMHILGPIWCGGEMCIWVEEKQKEGRIIESSQVQLTQSTNTKRFICIKMWNVNDWIVKHNSSSLHQTHWCEPQQIKHIGNRTMRLCIQITPNVLPVALLALK